MWEEGDRRIWGWFTGNYGCELQYPRRYSTHGYCSRSGLWRRLGLEGRKERRPRDFAHGRQERRVFLLISCLIKLIHLLSLNREDYVTPKQGLDLIPKPNPNGPPDPLDPWHLTLPRPFPSSSSSSCIMVTLKMTRLYTNLWPKNKPFKSRLIWLFLTWHRLEFFILFSWLWNDGHHPHNEGAACVPPPPPGSHGNIPLHRMERPDKRTEQSSNCLAAAPH
jgi:hypothetical protein